MKRVLAREKGAFLTLILIILSLIFSVQAAKMPPELIEQIQAKYPDGLPRYMTPEEQQWLDKQADIRSADTLRVESLGESELMYILPDGATEPPAGAIWAPPEYSSLQGILVRWTTSTSYDTALRGLVAQSSQATYVWCIVKNSTEQTAATTALTNAGANMSNVGFLTYTADSIWIRDYGPRYFFENNSHAIMDHAYNRPARPYDDGLPEWLAGYWSDPYYDLGLTHGGGNFHCFGNGDAFVSTLILDENPSYSEQDIKDIFRDYLNVDLTIYPRLISNIDATGHIDMWFLPLGDNKVLISEFPTSGYPLSRATTENAAADMAARGYTVYRVPAWNSNGEGSTGGTHYTYTNSVIINGSSKRVIIPSFSGFASQNSAALATFQSAMPDYTIVQVDCTNIIPLAGAVHCIMKHVYPATTPIPTIKVLSANGGEWWKVGTQQQIEWVASDDVSVASVDLYYSTNNGSSWNTIAAGLANTGSYDWTTPAVESAECLIRAVVYDGDSNTREDLSNKVFTISFSDPPPPPIETVYTFSGITNPSGSHKAQAGEIDVSDSMITGGTFPARQGTGITGWANWGEATTAEYAALVSSDDIRYSTVTSGPGYGDNAAMLFEFYVDEEPEDIVQLDVSVEIGRTSSTDLGYAYLWNYSTSSYLVLGTQSGTADMVISKTITTNPANYINPANGQVTVFVVNMNTNALIRTDQIQVTIYSQTSPVMQTLSVSSNSGGSVTTPGEGDFQYVQGTDANIVAAPDLNYHFVNWTGSGVDAGKVADANAADTKITMDADYAVAANFAIDTFSLDYAAGTGGSLTGETSQIVNYGENGTAVTAVPDLGYHFVNWSDDSTDNPRTDLSVTANISVTANFAIDTFTLDYAAGTGGTLAGETSQVVNYGSNGTAVTAIPNIGYYFVRWSDDSTENPRTDLNVTANINVTAIFTMYTFTLDYAAGAGGTLTGDTAQVVAYGSNGTAVTAVPDTGYHFVNWSDASTDNPRTDLNVTDNISVTANFAIDTFTLDYAAGLGGTLPGDTSQVVNYGENGTAVTALPN
ncbi:MAG: agmatine deiminase family protein, partial [Phycisphaerae bacterium]